MGLSQYRKKRDFKKSPEPLGGKPAGSSLIFVIQKHDASHLHYDFRLEMEGVLKSWAVPKGPSLDPSIKRLAMMVEDHPYDYRKFEGIIPSGYGAGTVIVWDEGTYEAAETTADDKKTMERELIRQLKAGKLRIKIQGQKLKGEFNLVKAAARGENAWLLMKVKDQFATKNDILKKDRSVLSHRNLEQVEKNPERYRKSHKEKSTKKKEKPQGIRSKLDADLLAKSKKKSFPKKLAPMLATLVDKPFEEEGWVFEVKWDGYRCLASMNKGKVEMRSRNDKSFNEKFYPLITPLLDWNINAVIDGEIVVLNDQGASDFSALQNWRSEADGDLVFYAFDILWYEGRDLTGLPLHQRKRILSALDPGGEYIRISESFEGPASEFFALAKEMGLEGIIAKRENARYHPGIRTRDWLKIKASKRQEVVIGGYTLNENTSKLFSSLLAGVFENGKFQYIGKIGTGFNVATQKELMQKFRKLEKKKCPFEQEPDISKPSRFRPNPPKARAVWLKPQLVCEVSYAEITGDGVMRHPSFVAMRIDKNAKDVKPEVALTASSKASERSKTIIKPAGKKERKTLLNPGEETQVRIIRGHEIKFNNLSKIFWPKEKVTKRDVLNYYYQVAPYLVPYLKDRPQSMNRYPNGINGKSFYQKDVTGKAPGWVETYLYHSPADERDKHFLVCADEAHLLYMASLGCIEINPWSSTIHTPDNPDWCMIDLDPAKTTFEQVIEAARVTKGVLDSAGVPSYPKTSGSTGLHIYIPLGAKYDYEDSREFARVVARLVHQEIPGFTSIERMVKNRGSKMYIDFLQNRPQATIAAPYSLRPKPGATVSMPLHWDEVKKGLRMKDFTIFNAVARLKETGDLFKPVLGKGIDLRKAVKKLQVMQKKAAEL